MIVAWCMLRDNNLIRLYSTYIYIYNTYHVIYIIYTIWCVQYLFLTSVHLCSDDEWRLTKYDNRHYWEIFPDSSVNGKACFLDHDVVTWLETFLKARRGTTHIHLIKKRNHAQLIPKSNIIGCSYHVIVMSMLP